MNNEINLLYSKKQQILNASASRARVVRMGAVGLLFLVGATSVVLFLLVISSPLPSLAAKEKELENTLKTSDAKIVNVTLAVIRLSDVKTIISKRSHYGDYLQALRDILPAGTDLTEFTVEKESVNITVSSPSLESIEEYFLSLSKLVEKGTPFQRVYVNLLEAVKDQDQQIKSFQVKLTLYF
ncbi:MAG: PilN domain-containing protein [Candidatus Levybacteria bacterium]|nr:PilN domain-containing protein [Candidatus Levybacteria bacterium]